MTFDRWRVEMLSHAIARQEELLRLLEQRRLRDASLAQGAESTGRAEWAYVPDNEAERLADLQEAVAAFNTVRWR